MHQRARYSVRGQLQPLLYLRMYSQNRYYYRHSHRRHHQCNQPGSLLLLLLFLLPDGPKARSNANANGATIKHVPNIKLDIPKNVKSNRVAGAKVSRATTKDLNVVPVFINIKFDVHSSFYTNNIEVLCGPTDRLNSV